MNAIGANLTRFGIALCLGIAATLFSPMKASAQSTPFFARMIGDPNYAAPLQTLECSSGGYMIGMLIKEGEWVSHVRLFCRGADRNAHWTSEATSAPEAGGPVDAEDLLSKTLCEQDSFISEINGKTAVVRRNGGYGDTDIYPADLRILCFNREAGPAREIRDSRFQCCSDGLTYGAAFPFPDGSERCPDQWAATGVRVISDGEDIRAIGLICNPLKAPIPLNEVPAPQASICETNPAACTTVPPPSGLCATNPAACATQVMQGAISVVSGTYGGNCQQPEGNVTAHLASTCNGQSSCEYSVDYTVIGDPAPGCAKDYVAKWTCGAGAEQAAGANAEAGYGSKVVLTCRSPVPPGY